MNPYTRKLIGFLCFSMGLALALGPYAGKRWVTRTVNAVFLSAAVPDLPPEDVPVLPSSRLNACPALKAYVTSLEKASMNTRILEQETTTVPRIPEPLNQTGFSSREPDEALKTLKKLSEEEDRRRRRHMKAMNARRWRSLCAEKRLDMAPGEWAALREHPGAESDTIRFRYGGYLISGRAESVTEKVLRRPSWFRPMRYIWAAAFLTLGMLAMRGAYGRRPGVRLNPVWSAFPGDIIIILFLGIGAFCLIDYALVKFFKMISLVDDPVFRGLCAIGYLPVTFFFAAFSANMGGQSVEIEAEGIRLHYPIDTRFLPWDTITGFSLKETSVMVGRIGILMPRKLQTKLVIRTDGGESSLVEPGLRETKTRLLRDLMAAAPERLYRDLKRLEKTW